MIQVHPALPLRTSPGTTSSRPLFHEAELTTSKIKTSGVPHRSAGVPSSRRRSSVAESVTESVLFIKEKVKSSAKQSLDYLLQSFGVSALASIWFLVGIVLVYHKIDMERYTYVFFDNENDRTIFPSVFKDGLRVVPINHILSNDYYIDIAPARYTDAEDTSSIFYYWSNSYTFMHPTYMAALVATLVFCKVIFVPNRVGEFLISILTILFCFITFKISTVHSNIVISNLEATKPGGNGEVQSSLRVFLFRVAFSVIYPPLACTIATKTSINLKQRPHGMKVFTAVLVFFLFLVTALHLTLFFIFPSYFSETSSLLYKMFVRSFVITISLHSVMEVTWQLTKYLHVECCVYEKGHLFMGISVVFISTIGRMMQAGANDVATSTIMEVVASIVEIYIAHGLLLGMTPYLEFLYILARFKYLVCKTKEQRIAASLENTLRMKRRASARDHLNERRKMRVLAIKIGLDVQKMKNNLQAKMQVKLQGTFKVLPMSSSNTIGTDENGAHSHSAADEGNARANVSNTQAAAPNNKMDNTSLVVIDQSESVVTNTTITKHSGNDHDNHDVMNVDMLREHFCLNCLLYMTMSEGALIFFCLIFTLTTSFNINDPGSERIPKSQALASFVIMFIGEVVFTNAVVAWMSKNKRYGVDLSIAWAARDKFLFAGFTLILMMFPLQAFWAVFKSLCLTSYTDEDYVFTICPTKPDSLMDMARVGLSWNSTWTDMMMNENL